MTRERVDELICGYRETLARYEFLRHELREFESILASFKRSMIADSVNITQVISDMPRGSATSDPTARLAMFFASGAVPKYVSDLEREIEAVKAEIEQTEPKVVLVQAWLKGLTDRNRYLVEHKIIGGEFWRAVVTGFEQTFGEAYSKQGLKKMLESAMESVYRIAH